MNIERRSKRQNPDHHQEDRGDDLQGASAFQRGKHRGFARQNGAYYP